METYCLTACEAAPYLRELHGPGDGAELVGLPSGRQKEILRQWLLDAANKVGHPLNRIDLAFALALKKLPQRSSAVEGGPSYSAFVRGLTSALSASATAAPPGEFASMA